jgi:hypothetical protein
LYKAVLQSRIKTVEFVASRLGDQIAAFAFAIAAAAAAAAVIQSFCSLSFFLSLTKQTLSFECLARSSNVVQKRIPLFMAPDEGNANSIYLGLPTVLVRCLIQNVATSSCIYV